MVSLLEDKWDEPMLWDPTQFGIEGDLPASVNDPMQVWGIRSIMPKGKLPNRLKEEQNQETESHLLSDVHELKSVQNYLKANSANAKYPLMMFPVSRRLHWTFVLVSDVLTRRLYTI